MSSRQAIHSIKDAVAHVDVDDVTRHANDAVNAIKNQPQNLGDTEKKVSVLGGSALGAIALTRLTRPSGWLLMGVAAGLILRGTTGFCGLYKALGINTRE